MSKGEKDKQVLSHLSDKELAERALTPTDEWITVPEGVSPVEFLQKMLDEVAEEGRKRRKKQDNG